MRFSALLTALAFAAGSSFLLAGCGGGGGGGGGSSSGSNQDRNAVINSSNMKDVGAQTYAVIDWLNQQITNAPAEVTDPTNADLSGSRCPNGGTATRTVNSNTITIQYSNCDNRFQIINGSAIIQLSLLPNNHVTDNAWSGTLAVTFNNLVFKLSPYLGLNELLNIVSSESGDITVDYVQTAPNVGTFHATNNSLQWKLTSGNSVIDRNVSGLIYSGSIDATNRVTFNAKYTLAGKLGKLGTVSYGIETKNDFQRQYSNSAYQPPTQGAMTVTATDKSSLTLRAVDASAASLDLDWNGDTVIDKTVPTTWNELNSVLQTQF